jgi:hypothetical protein
MGVTMIGDVFTVASFQDLKSASRPCPPTPDAIDAESSESRSWYGARIVGGERHAHARPQLSTPLVSRAVAWARAGDREALRFLYARYADDVFGSVRDIVPDPHEADDVTCQVFAELTRTIGGYEQRDAPFSAWIVGVARNVAEDHVRRQRSVLVDEVRTSPA